MAKYLQTHKAVEDLNRIWSYTSDNWSEEQADEYYNMKLEFCQEIADKPELGRNYEGVRTDLLGLKANRHIIFYRKIQTDVVEVTRILHGRMDLKHRITE